MVGLSDLRWIGAWPEVGSIPGVQWREEKVSPSVSVSSMGTGKGPCLARGWGKYRGGGNFSQYPKRQVPFVCLMAWLMECGKTWLTVGSCLPVCEVECGWRLDFKENHVGRGLRMGLEVVNGRN